MEQEKTNNATSAEPKPPPLPAASPPAASPPAASPPAATVVVIDEPRPQSAATMPAPAPAPASSTYRRYDSFDTIDGDDDEEDDDGTHHNAARDERRKLKGPSAIYPEIVVSTINHQQPPKLKRVSSAGDQWMERRAKLAQVIYQNRKKTLYVTLLILLTGGVTFVVNYFFGGAIQQQPETKAIMDTVLRIMAEVANAQMSEANVSDTQRQAIQSMFERAIQENKAQTT